MLKTSGVSSTPVFVGVLKDARIPIVICIMLFGLAGALIPGVFKYQLKAILNIGYIGSLPFESSPVLLNKLNDTQVFTDKFKGKHFYISAYMGPAPNTLLLAVKADSVQIVNDVTDEAVAFLNQEYNQKYQVSAKNVGQQIGRIDKAISEKIFKKGFPAEASVLEMERQKYFLNTKLWSPFETYPNSIAYKSEMKERSISLIRFAYISFSAVMGFFIGIGLSVFLAAAGKKDLPLV